MGDMQRQPSVGVPQIATQAQVTSKLTDFCAVIILADCCTMRAHAKWCSGKGCRGELVSYA